MPEIDMNELKRRDPKAFHQRLYVHHAGEARHLREQMSDARNSVERGRLQAKIDEAQAEAAYHRNELERLSSK